MPTTREFEDVAVDFCLDHCGVGVWAMQLEQVNFTECNVTIRLGGHHRGEPGGIAIIRVSYHPQQACFTCRPAEPALPDAALANDPAYLSS